MIGTTSDHAADLAVLEATTDHALRDRLALRLTDAGVPGTADALIRLIAREDLADHRGALVYCLGQFDCSGYTPMLVDLVAKANFEVANLAFRILDDMEPSAPPDVDSPVVVRRSAVSDAVEDWRRELLEHLLTRGFR